MNQSETSNIQTQNQEQANENQVFTYNSDWTIYSIGMSCRPSTFPRVAIGSFDESVNNEVCVLSLNRSNSEWESRGNFAHKYSPTKLLWIPDKQGTQTDLLASSAEFLKIWEVDDENQKINLKCDLINTSEFNAPLTSFDWNSKSLNYIGTASIDTTCTIWDVEKQTVFTQLIAHDKEVYDISFSCEEKIFASVGADGSCRQFDQRSLDHSTVLYETENNQPLVKLAWNQLDSNYLAVIEMDEKYVTLLDTRQPLYPLAKLKNHKDCVNAIAWAPQSSTHICSVADDSVALIWDLSDLQQKDPLLEYKAESEISNLSWSLCQNDLVGICYGNILQLLIV